MPVEPTLTVSGEGAVAVTPDICTLHANIHVLAETAAGAIAECSRLANLAVGALSERGIDGPDIVTTSLRMQDWIDADRSVVGRLADYALQVTLHTMDEAGAVVDALVEQAGDALQVRSIDLGIGDSGPARREARRLAVEDARQKAAEIADAAGVSLGSIIEIVEGGAVNGGPRLLRSRTAYANAASLPVEPGTIAVRSTVVISYAVDNGEGATRRLPTPLNG